jgi:Methylamine utilisation protein MauE
MTFDRMFCRYRAALCGSTLLMVGLSWPLWVDDPDFPRVPFFSRVPVLPAWVSWLVLVGIVATLAATTVGWRWRLMLRISLPLLSFAILQDQNRFQPWAYQYAVIGLAMATLSKARALRMARWYVLGLYYYSGLSKLDASFCRELGPTFLSAALGPFGLSPGNWPEATRTLACLAMPGFEIAVATLLLFARTRRVGLVGAIAQHLALVFILGPWNLGHSTIVLVWNLALIVEDLILFGKTTIPPEIEADTGLGRVARPAFWLVMLLPAGERLGFCDAWPGHALYASHAERADVSLHEDELDRFPDSIRRRLGPGGSTPWRRLDMTAWSRELRGTPLYPSGRVGNAVAEFLEARFGGLQPVRLVQWGRAPAWDGPRDRDESLGLRAIRRRGDQFLFNAHPTGLGRP